MERKVDSPVSTGLPPYAVQTPTLDDVASAVTGLLSNAFAGVTGQTMAVDGGRWMAP